MSEPSDQNLPSAVAGNSQATVPPHRAPLKVLAWGDSALAGTGFGVVSKNVLRSIHATGRYTIHHLAINHHGDFVENNDIPWQMQPARLLDIKDPHGVKMFLQKVAKGDYDILWVLNDIFVTHEASKALAKIFDEKKRRGQKVPILIYYYPVDCHVPARSASFVEIADIPVCYTDHGRAETLKTLPQLQQRLRQVPHGVESSIFRPVSEAEARAFKARVLHTDKNPYVVINVNRNSSRKQIPYSMMAFQRFKKLVPNSIMYIHSAVQDQGGDLRIAAQDLGMGSSKDIVFPLNYAPSTPVSVATMNMIYNMADLFLTTHLGEGWGLTVSEAMASGTPVVAPYNTSMPELLGTHGERGYLYPCNDSIWIDPSGYRPKGLLPDIVDQMVAVYKAGHKQDDPKVKAARTWAEGHDWKIVNEQWKAIFLYAEDLINNKNLTKVHGEMI